MRDVIDGRNLALNVKKMDRSRKSPEKREYFTGIANARFVMRRVFRIVEEQAREEGLDSVAHQALIQIYGSPDAQLRVKHLAERLDISPAFGSNLTRALVEKGYVVRIRGGEDRRATQVAITQEGIELLCKIDEAVAFHVDYFTRQLTREQREMTIYILMFYVGVSIALPVLPG
jgi:DNA-binding MarR family transcriptional regulator